MALFAALAVAVASAFYGRDQDKKVDRQAWRDAMATSSPRETVGPGGGLPTMFGESTKRNKPKALMLMGDDTLSLGPLAAKQSLTGITLG